MEDKTILLTGATGFLGSYLLEYLLKERYNIIILKRSFSDTWRIKNFLKYVKVYDIDESPLTLPFQENRVDLIIHTATNYGRNTDKISEIINTNLLFPLRLIEIAISFHTDTFLNTDTLLNKYLSEYTLSKKQQVEWLKILSKKIKIVNMKIEHMYGPKDDCNKFVCWLIKELIQEKKEIKLTQGEQKRDFIYILDVVSAYLTVLKNLKNFENYSEFDVGTGNFITIKELVYMIKEITEKLLNRKLESKLKFGAIPYREGEFLQVEENLSELLKLGWKPEYDLKRGLSDTITYCIGDNR